MSKRFIPFTLIAAALVVWTSASMAGVASTSQRDASDRFWARVTPQSALEAEHYESLSDMTASADAVVLGRIVEVLPGRVFGNPASYPVGAAASYATAIVEVTDVLSGDPGARTLQLELLLPDAEVLADLQAALPRERAVYFLRNKGHEAALLGLPPNVQANERPFFRLVNTRAVLRDIDGNVAAPVSADEGFLLELDGTPFSDLLATLRDVEPTSRPTGISSGSPP